MSNRAVRNVFLIIITLLLMTGWRIVRALGAEPLDYIALMTLGIVPGAGMAALVLWVGARAEPDEHTYSHDHYQVAPDADERTQLEAEYNSAGHWTTINGRTCYVVPGTDGWTGDGEELGVGDSDDWQYWFGDYCSDRQFVIAGVLTDSGAVVRRSPISWWNGYL